jgi:predicted nucleic acid-binding protein
VGLIIDTCIFIHGEKYGINFHELNFNKWKKYNDSYITAITVSELLVGVHRANSKERKIKRSAYVEPIISQMDILPFDEECARIHAQLNAYLQEKGIMIGAHDLIIAATAVCHSHALLTFNEKEFRRIPGLKVEKVIIEN